MKCVREKKIYIFLEKSFCIKIWAKMHTFLTIWRLDMDETKRNFRSETLLKFSKFLHFIKYSTRFAYSIKNISMTFFSRQN